MFSLKSPTSGTRSKPNRTEPKRTQDGKIKKPRQRILPRLPGDVRLFDNSSYQTHRPKELENRRPFFGKDGTFDWLGYAKWHTAQPDCPIEYYGWRIAEVREVEYQKSMIGWVPPDPPRYYEGAPDVDEVSRLLIEAA